MVLTYAYGEFIHKLRPVWVVDRNGSDGLTDPLLTADPAVMASFPLSIRRPSRFYLPDRTVTPDAPIVGPTPVYRGNHGTFYTKRLDDYGLMLEETLGSSWPDALDESVSELKPPSRLTPSRTRRYLRTRRTTSDRSLGYGWQLESTAKFVPDLLVTINGPTQQHAISFDRRAGGQIDNWAVTMDVPAVNRQIVNRGYDYGRCIQTAMFLIEDQLGTQSIHNPTQAGDDTGSLPNEDWEAQASPLLHLSSTPLQDGSVRVLTMATGLDFGSASQGGGLYTPVLWFGNQIGTEWIFNWNGREGIHRRTLRYYQPFEIPYLASGAPPAVQAIQMSSFAALIMEFDEWWIYDAANDTETEAREGIEAPAYDGSTDTIYFVLRDNLWTSTGVPGPFAPHPMPSLIGGIILRGTGAFRGAADDFSIGIFAQLQEYESGRGLAQRGFSEIVYKSSYLASVGNTKDDINRHAQSFDTHGKGLAKGWHTATHFFLTGTYAQVKANMRQLYLEGAYGPSYAS